MAATSRHQLIRVWLLSVGVLTVLVGVSISTRTGGDDPDQGRQRPGILDLGELPIPAPKLPNFEPDEREAVVFFAGRKAAELCEALAHPPADLVEAELVVVSEESTKCGSLVMRVEMSPADAATAYGLPKPRDGGPPLGYAIVDATGRIRYRTLDPEVPSMLEEVVTMLRAVR